MDETQTKSGRYSCDKDTVYGDQNEAPDNAKKSHCSQRQCYEPRFPSTNGLLVFGPAIAFTTWPKPRKRIMAWNASSMPNMVLVANIVMTKTTTAHTDQSEDKRREVANTARAASDDSIRL